MRLIVRVYIYTCVDFSSLSLFLTHSFIFRYMFGGYNGMDRLNDLYCYRFDTGVWTRLHGDQAAVQPPLVHHHDQHPVPTSRALPAPPPMMMAQHPLMPPNHPLNSAAALSLHETPPMTPPTTTRAHELPLAGSEDEEDQGGGSEGSLFPLRQVGASSSSRAEEDDEASRGLHSMSSLRLGDNDASTANTRSLSGGGGMEGRRGNLSAQSPNASTSWNDSPSSSSSSSSLRTKPLEVPSGRSSLVSVVYKNSLFVFGGYNGQVCFPSSSGLLSSSSRVLAS